MADPTITEAAPTCACGCGQTVNRNRNEWSKFRQGHYAKTVPPGPTHHRWRNGRYVDERGYVRLHVPGGGYVREHRLVMSQVLGRPLLPHEVVHHIDGNKQNNSPENLELCGSQAEHLEQHPGDWRRPKVPRQRKTCHCGLPAHGLGLCGTHYAALRRQRRHKIPA